MPTLMPALLLTALYIIIFITRQIRIILKVPYYKLSITWQFPLVYQDFWIFSKPWHLRTFSNTDGLIKCLPPTHDSFVTIPKIYARKLCSIYIILWHPDSFVSRNSIFGLAGRRAGALFFARHLDYFTVTRNSQPLPGLGTYTQLHRDPKFTTIYRDWQKTRHRDADGT